MEDKNLSPEVPDTKDLKANKWLTIVNTVLRWLVSLHNIFYPLKKAKK